MRKLTLLFILFSSVANSQTIIPGPSTSGGAIAPSCSSGVSTACLDGTNLWTSSNSFLDANFFILDNVDQTKKFQFQVSSITTGTTRTITIPDADFTIPILPSPVDDTTPVGNGTVWEGKTLPNCTDTGGNHLNYTAATNTYSCGTSGSAALPVVDTTSIVEGSVDATKEIRFEVDGLTTGTVRVITPPDSNTTLPIFSQIATFAGLTAARTITLPDVNFTVAGLGVAQTFSVDQTFGTNILAGSDNAVALGATATRFSNIFSRIVTVGTSGAYGIMEAPASNFKFDTNWDSYLFRGTANAFMRATLSGGVQLESGLSYTFAQGGDPEGTTEGGLHYATTLTPDSLYMGVGPTANSLHIGEWADRAFDFQNGPCGTSNCADPTLIIHSHNQNTTQWISLTHNATDGVLDVGAGGLDLSGITGTYKYDRTITAAGTTGEQEINKTAGTVNLPTSANTIVVTNALVSANSIVFAVRRTADATCFLAGVEPDAGSFTIRMTAVCTAETSIGFFVIN